MPPENLKPQDHPTEPLLEAGLIQSKQIGDETNSLLEAIIQQNSENNPEPILEAMLVQDKQNTEAIVEALKPTAEATSKLAQFLTDMKGDKGDKGDDGIDGKDADEPAIIQSVLAQIPVPENGIDGRDGLDGQDGTDGRDGRDGVDGRDGKDGIDGKSPTIDYKKIVAETVKRVPEIDIDAKVKEITDAVSQQTNDTLQSIRTKVASRTYSMGELSDTQSATAGQTMVKQANGTWAPATSGAGGGHTIEDEGTPVTQRTNLNFVGPGVTVTDDAGNDATVVTIPGGGGGGAVDSVNGETGVVVLTTDDISDTAQTNKWATASEKTKLGHISVTQAVDLDALETASHAAVTITDSTSIDITLTGQDITAQREALTGAITAPKNSNTTSLGSFTVAQLNTAISDADVATGGGTATGTNTGDQTTIVGITGTKAQFDTAVTDGNFMYIGDAPTAHTHLLAAGATDVTITAANLNSLDDGADSTLHFHATDRARANHTGSQLASTISDFASTVLSTVLTGISFVTGTAVTAADSILVAIGKLQKQNTDQDTAIAARAVSTRAINTTAPLSGGGDLNADRTLTTSMATNKLIGRGTAGTGVFEEITLGTNLSLTGTTLNASGVGGSTTNINQLYIDQAGGTASTYGALAGAINGSNTVFTVSQGIYGTGSLIVLLFGQGQTNGTAEDWTETTPGSGTFTFAVAPPTGSKIIALYQRVTTSASSFDELAQDAVGTILVNSAEIDFTYNDATPSITASIIASSIDETKLDASVNASLDLADSASQPGHTHLFTAGATDVTMTAANLNTLDDGVNTTLHFHDSDRARTNHTGTQLASTISDFAATVRSTVLTGLSLISTTVISATDTILVALGSLQAQITALTTTVASKVASVTAGTNTTVTGTATNPVVNVPTMTATVGGAVPTPPNNTTTFLRGDGTFASPAGGGTGDVVGPISATDNAIARFDATTGKLIQNSLIGVNDSGQLTSFDDFIAVDQNGDFLFYAAGQGATAVNYPFSANSATGNPVSFAAFGTDTNISISLEPKGTGKIVTTKDMEVADEVYGAGWNGSLEVPTKNAVYDAMITRVVRVVHGAVASTARPSDATYIEWVGSVEPTNATNNDTWVVTT